MKKVMGIIRVMGYCLVMTPGGGIDVLQDLQYLSSKMS